MVSIIIFTILFLFTIIFFGWNILKVRKNILIGKDINRSDNKAERMIMVITEPLKKLFSLILCKRSDIDKGTKRSY